MRSSGWVLIQYDRCLRKKGKFGHTDWHVQTEEHRKIPSARQGMPKATRSEEGGLSRLSPREVRKNQSCCLPESGLPASRTVRQSVSADRVTPAFLPLLEQPQATTQASQPSICHNTVSCRQVQAIYQLKNVLAFSTLTSLKKKVCAHTELLYSFFELDSSCVPTYKW